MNITKKDLSVIRSLIKYAKLHGINRRSHYCAAAARKKIVFGRNYYGQLGNKDLRNNYEYNCPHAEFDAISRAKMQCDRVYVIRMNKQGCFMNSEPCEECRRFMKLKRVVHVIYTGANGDLIKEKLR